MTAMDLRPLSLAELLDRAFTLYRRHLWLFVGIMAVPSAFGLVFSLLIEVTNRRAIGGFDQSVASPEQAILVGATMVGGMLVAMVAYFLVYAVALGAITLAVSELYQGRMTTIREVYREVRPRLGSLLLLLLGMGLRAGLAFAALTLLTAVISGFVAAVTSPVAVPVVMVPGMLIGGGLVFFMMLRWGVAVPALVLEERKANDAIRRSIELTRGRLGRVLLLVVCATVIAYAALMLFQGPFLVASVFAGPDSAASFWFAILGTVAGTIGATFTGPIMIVGLALLYYDARVRDEGLDLQLMMAALDGRAAPLARG
jgi:membrane-anchored glycerophosphoryl diester phosphodiesterase (GDPDase)